MTAISQSTRRKLSLLELAHELQNVSKACRIMGYHRDWASPGLTRTEISWQHCCQPEVRHGPSASAIHT
jgi:hypothetical protein